MSAIPNCVKICTFRVAGGLIPTRRMQPRDKASADIGTPAATEASEMNECNAPEAATATGGPRAQDQVRMPRARGVQAPPFVAQNTEAVSFLVKVFEAQAGAEVQAVEISEAVALQIRDLVFSGVVSQLNFGWACVWALLASLKAGRRVGRANSAMLHRLRQVFDRKTSATSQVAPGLSIAFATAIKKRNRDDEMRGMDKHEARAHLLLRWDKCDFAFDFGELAAAAGGGGGDPDGGGGGEPTAAKDR